MSHPNAWVSRLEAVKAKGRIPIIAEIKPASPADGDLLKGRRVETITRAYIEGGAACLSVVTGRWFGGDISLLSRVARLSRLPLLRKDLIVNKKQIRQSRDCGANAVLLTGSILSTSHLMKLMDHCLSLGMTPFIEVSDEAALNQVKACCESVIAITNRDISRKETDTDSGLKSMDLAGALKHVSAGAIISASGIHTIEEAQKLFGAGFDGLLIGTALLKAPDPKAALIKFTQGKDDDEG
jgi:indole-3-glycerol phosphate synthase